MFQAILRPSSSTRLYASVYDELRLAVELYSSTAGRYKQNENNNRQKMERVKSKKLYDFTSLTREILGISLKEEPIPQMVDVDCNFTHKDLASDMPALITASAKCGISEFIVPGSTIEESKQCIKLANEYPGKIFATLGVHPYNSKHLQKDSDFADTLKRLYNDQKVNNDLKSIVAIGECGLDYSDGFPPCQDQIWCFEKQVALACKLNIPLFLHERLAFDDFCKVLDTQEKISQKLSDDQLGLPPIIIHCFTGTLSELKYYLERGFYVSFSGVLCNKTRGKALYANGGFKWSTLLDRIMIETDSPYLGFKKCRKGQEKAENKTYPNVPTSLPHVASCLSQCLSCDDLAPVDVANITARNARIFFGLPRK
eukprot:GSMAST32.ASY1.ANO1.2675.1 assembled CDS